jgi:uncharacterized protein (DUF302 family)
METTRYGLRATTTLDCDEAEEAIRAALAEEGFGILTEIDVAETLKAKLGLERTPYRILGACNPTLAARALEVEADIGLLLPCNVVVYESAGGTVVAALDPGTMVDLTDNQELSGVAEQVRERLERALRSLPA